MQNLESKGTISASSTRSVGGIVGQIKGTQLNKAQITNCTNSASITSYEWAGGICGSATFATITCCKNNSMCNSSGLVLGGICGVVESASLIDRCINTSSVTGAGSVGGIVGDTFTDATIRLSYNTGSVSGNQAVGGILGKVYCGRAEVLRCYNSASLTASDSCVGGIVGTSDSYHDSSELYISSCYNIGRCTGNSSGGIFGCLANSQIHATSGKVFDSKANIKDSYWSDKDKNNNTMPSNAVGYSYNSNKLTIDSYTVGKYNLSDFYTQDPWNGYHDMYYWLNGQSTAGAFAQDFNSEGGYINNKYPYLVENPPQ